MQLHYLNLIVNLFHMLYILRSSCNVSGLDIHMFRSHPSVVMDMHNCLLYCLSHLSLFRPYMMYIVRFRHSFCMCLQDKVNMYFRLDIFPQDIHTLFRYLLLRSLYKYMLMLLYFLQVMLLLQDMFDSFLRCNMYLQHIYMSPLSVSFRLCKISFLHCCLYMIVRLYQDMFDSCCLSDMSFQDKYMMRHLYFPQVMLHHQDMSDSLFLLNMYLQHIYMFRLQGSFRFCMFRFRLSRLYMSVRLDQDNYYIRPLLHIDLQDNGILRLIHSFQVYTFYLLRYYHYMSEHLNQDMSSSYYYSYIFRPDICSLILPRFRQGMLSRPDMFDSFRLPDIFLPDIYIRRLTDSFRFCTFRFRLFRFYMFCNLYQDMGYSFLPLLYNIRFHIFRRYLYYMFYNVLFLFYCTFRFLFHIRLCSHYSFYRLLLQDSLMTPYSGRSRLPAYILFYIRCSFLLYTLSSLIS